MCTSCVHIINCQVLRFLIILLYIPSLEASGQSALRKMEDHIHEVPTICKGFAYFRKQKL